MMKLNFLTLLLKKISFLMRTDYIKNVTKIQKSNTQFRLSKLED